MDPYWMTKISVSWLFTFSFSLLLINYYLPMRHILSAKQFSRSDLDHLMSEAQKMDTILAK